jgi:hypothetical protein
MSTRNLIKSLSSMQTNIQFKYPLSTNGRNGKVFIVTLKENQENIVCKISKLPDFTIRHEYNVMETLYKLNLPNFPVPYTLSQITVDANYRKKINPLSITPELYPVTTDAMFFEYIEDGIELDKFINKTKDTKLVNSLIEQVILSVCMAYDVYRFTHYDLHCGNVLVRPTKISEVEYTINSNKYKVKTYGYIAVIIDFGLSYIDGLDFLYCPLFHTNIGVLTHTHNKHTDLKLFLVSLANDTNINSVKKLTDRLYSNLKLNPENGWDILEGGNALDHVYYKLYDDKTSCSRMFSQHGYICFAILQSLIQYPLNPQQVSTSKSSYKLLEKEFSKIENLIGSMFYNIYVFKEMVDIARRLKEDYSSIDTRDDAVREFKLETLQVIDKIAKFCRLSDVQWETILCSLYLVAAYIESEMLKYISIQYKPYKLSVEHGIEVYNKFKNEYTKSSHSKMNTNLWNYR